jgi:hypothetical protein
MEMKVNYDELKKVLAGIREDCKNLPLEMHKEVIMKKTDFKIISFTNPIVDFSYNLRSYIGIKLIHSVLGKCIVSFKGSEYQILASGKHYPIYSGIMNWGFFHIDLEQ